MTIYFDNAATSWPKPEKVYRAMDHFMREVGANPGRSGHRQSIEAGRIIYLVRKSLAEMLGVCSEDRVILALNATDGLNMAIKGTVEPGDHIITSSMEHNAVMRPLRGLQDQKKIELTIVPCSEQGYLDPDDIKKAVQRNTKTIILNHASNVTGNILPVKEVGEIAKNHHLRLIVDGAQTAGVLPIDIDDLGVDIYAFTGHKGLLGPQGTGGLCLGNQVSLKPWREGGTGSRSESDRQPDFLPDSLEAGTPNTVGAAGLKAALDFLLHTGIDQVRDKELALTQRLWEGLDTIKRVKMYGPAVRKDAVAVVSFVVNGQDPAVTALTLEEKGGIACRTGLHCAPHAHKTIGSHPTGTIRFSLGIFNTPEEVDAAIKVVEMVS